MVRGNKFKPGEPPLKKRRLLEAQTKSPVEKNAEPVVPVVMEDKGKDSPISSKAVKRRAENEDSEHVPHNDMHTKKKQRVNLLQEKSQRLTISISAEPEAALNGHKSIEDPGIDGRKSQKSSANKRKKARRKAQLSAQIVHNDYETPKKSDKLNGKTDRELQVDKDHEKSAEEAGTLNSKKPKYLFKQGKKLELDKEKSQSHPNLVRTSLASPKQGSSVSSNWAQIKKLIGAGTQKDRHLKGDAPLQGSESARPEPKGDNNDVTPIVAVDCEMVGVGPDGSRSSLARVCIVNEQGNVLMDKFVRQKERITDYRTKFSGIRPQDVSEDNAESFEDVQKQAAEIFKDRIIVGHAIHNDLRALLLGHPNKMIRDTSKYPPLMRSVGPGRKPKPKALRHLAFDELGLGIQSGEHSPVEDARAALYLYQRHAKIWERHIKRGSVSQLRAPLGKRRLQEEQARVAQQSLAALSASDVMWDL